MKNRLRLVITCGIMLLLTVILSGFTVELILDLIFWFSYYSSEYITLILYGERYDRRKNMRYYLSLLFCFVWILLGDSFYYAAQLNKLIIFRGIESDWANEMIRFAVLGVILSLCASLCYEIFLKASKSNRGLSETS